jgi:hypothetical protein
LTKATSPFRRCSFFAIAQKEGQLTLEPVEAVEGLAEDNAAILEAYNRRVLAAQPDSRCRRH